MPKSEVPDNGLGKTTAVAILEPAANTMLVPAMVAAAGERAALRFIDFFTANIRNPNTRAAYAVAVRGFFAWLDQRDIRELGAIRTHHVSAYVETLTRTYKAPTVKQHLAALRMLFDWLIVGQVVEQNPAAAVRGPKHVVKKGKTPVLDGDEAKKLIDSIDVSTIVGLRDRALIALLIYSFARISAALHMNVEDYYRQGKLVGAPARERRQAARDASAPPARGLHRRICDGERHRRREGLTPLPHPGRPRPQAVNGRSDEPAGRAAHDRATRPEGRHHHAARLPHLPGDRDHGLSAQRRIARIRPADGGA